MSGLKIRSHQGSGTGNPRNKTEKGDELDEKGSSRTTTEKKFEV